MPLSFRCAPRISSATFTGVLARYKSPCAPIAAECYAITCEHRLDPAVALAFFGHESVFGTRGIGTETRNWGNVRTPMRHERITGTHPRNFAIFRTWQDGLRDWCERINGRYIDGRGLDTVEKAIPVYAPSSDGNNEQRYIEHVNQLVASWMSEEQQQPAPGGSRAEMLREALLHASFATARAQLRPDQAFYQYMIRELKAGRPLGNPLGEQHTITVNGQTYVIQVFALDTIYAPVPRWNEIGRLSDLLKA